MMKKLFIFLLLSTLLFGQAWRNPSIVPYRLIFNEKSDAEITDLDNPPTAWGFVYEKDDQLFYFMDEDSVEYILSFAKTGNIADSLILTADGDSIKFLPYHNLYMIDVEVDNNRIFAIDSTGIVRIYNQIEATKTEASEAADGTRYWDFVVNASDEPASSGAEVNAGYFEYTLSAGGNNDFIVNALEGVARSSFADESATMRGVYGRFYIVPGASNTLRTGIGGEFSARAGYSGAEIAAEQWTAFAGARIWMAPYFTSGTLNNVNNLHGLWLYNEHPTNAVTNAIYVDNIGSGGGWTYGLNFDNSVIVTAELLGSQGESWENVTDDNAWTTDGGLTIGDAVTDTTTFNGPIYSDQSYAAAQTVFYFKSALTANSGEFNNLRGRAMSQATGVSTSDIRGIYGQAVTTADKFGGTNTGVFANAIAKNNTTTLTLRGLFAEAETEATPNALTNLYGSYIRTKAHLQPATDHYGLMIDNEIMAIGFPTDAYIGMKSTNWSGADASAYGIDMNAVEGFSTADIRLHNGAIIYNSAVNTITIANAITWDMGAVATLDFDGAFNITSNNGKQTFTSTAGQEFITKIIPDADGGADIGTSTLGWGDVYLDSAKVIDWNSDVTMTHSDDLLIITGGNTRVDELEVTDGTDLFRMSVVSDKLTIWNDAGTPVEIAAFDSTGKFYPGSEDDTYIHMQSADAFSTVVGGTEAIRIIESGDDITVNLYLTVDDVTISDGGTGYDAGDLVFSGGNPTIAATGTYTVTGNVIDGTTITSPGSGYTSVPTVAPSHAGNGDAVLATVVRISRIILPTLASSSAPILSFGNNTGFHSYISTVIDASLEGSNRWRFTTIKFGSSSSDGPAMSRSAATDINPVFIIRQDNEHTGIGGSANYLSLIENEKEVIRILEGNAYVSSVTGAGAAVETIENASTTNGAATLTKAAENFDATCSVGDVILVYGGTTEADYGTYIVIEVTGATILTVDRNFGGSNADVDFDVLADGIVIENATDVTNHNARLRVPENAYIGGTLDVGDISTGDITISDNDPVLSYIDETGADDDVNVTIAVDLVTATSGAEDATFTIQNQVDGTMRDMLVNVVEGDFTITSYKGQVILKSANITALTLEADQDALFVSDILMSTGKAINWNSTDIMTHSANTMTLSGFTTWDMAAVILLDFNGATTIQTSTGQLDIATDAGDGDIVLTPHGTGDIILDGYWNFNANALTSLTDNHTTITAFAGKEVQIELVTFDAGAMTSITTLSMNNQLTNTLAIGTSPFVITSTTVNTNLNADLLDGESAAAFENADAGLTSLAGLAVTAGDMIIATGADAYNVLDNGTAGYVLVANGAGNPIWTEPTGTGAPAKATSPTFVTPTLGVAGATSLTISGAPADGISVTTTGADGIHISGVNTANNLHLSGNAVDNMLLIAGTDPTRGIFMTGGFQDAIKIEGSTTTRRGLFFKQDLQTRHPDAADDNSWGIYLHQTHGIDNAAAHLIGVASYLNNDVGSAFQVLNYEGEVDVSTEVNRIAGSNYSFLVTQEPLGTTPWAQTGLDYVGINIFQNPANTIEGDAAIAIDDDWTSGIWVGATELTNFIKFQAADGCIAADASGLPANATYKIKCNVGGVEFYLIGVADF